MRTLRVLCTSTLSVVSAFTLCIRSGCLPYTDHAPESPLRLSPPIPAPRRLYLVSPRQLLQSETGVPHFALDPLTYRCLLSLSPAADFAEPCPPRHSSQSNIKVTLLNLQGPLYFQSGFRPSHSTETALIRVTNESNGCISLLVRLDLSATFDTIDHNILLNRLENFVAIGGSALAWFKSYLSDRHQFVAVNEEISYRSQVQYGVPQGSVLGPLIIVKTYYYYNNINLVSKPQI